MKTDIEVIPAEVVPGKKIVMVEHNVRNFRIHLALQHVSTMQMAMIENDSGNTSDLMIPQNKASIYGQFGLIKAEFEFAKNHNDPALANYEEAYKILLLAGKEIMKIQNIKQKRVIMEADRLGKVLLGLSSAALQGNIDEKCFVIIDKQVATLEAAMILWFGPADDADMGLKVPSNSHLGHVTPSVDLDYSSTLEPSTGLPMPQLPDAQDV